MNNVKYKKIDYVVMALTIQFSLVSFWASNRIYDLILFTIIFVYHFLKKGRISADIKLFVVFFVYTILIAWQGVIWGFSFISYINAFLFLYYLNYLMFKTLEFNFFNLFEKVFRFFTKISLTFWTIQQIIPSTKYIFLDWVHKLNVISSDSIERSMIIYTYWPTLENTKYYITRNAGFLHEPGAFATFAIFAIIINYINGRKLLHKYNWIYYIATLTTLSTAGYVSLVFLLLLLIKQPKNRIVSLFAFILILALIQTSFKNFDFLSSKIEYQLNDQLSKNLNEETSGRFYGARKSINVLLKNPISGRGLNSISKPVSNKDEEFANYGWLSYVSQLGIIFGIIFIILFIKGLKTFISIRKDTTMFDTVIIITSIMINLSSQSFITSPFFFIFFYIGYYKLKPITNNILLSNEKIINNRRHRLIR